jgi:cytochrome c556
MQDAAASEKAGDAGKSPAETGADAGAGSGKVLQGGVRGSAVKLEEGLEMIDSSSKLIQGSALQLTQECTRKEQTVMRGPNYIGNGIVIPALGGNGSGIVMAGELPARKDKVEAFLSTVEDGIKALKTHVDGLIIPEGSPDDMTKLWQSMQGSMQTAETNIAAMREIVAQVPTKKGEIKQKDAKPLGRAALKVYDSMTELIKLRKQMDNLVKPELKK